MTPAQELIAAADKLDALIAGATDGPWVVEDTGTGERADILSYEVAEPSRLLWAAIACDVPLPNAAYTAAMNPLVGKALLGMLREEAAEAAIYRGPHPAHLFRHALRFARLINGGES